MALRSVLLSPIHVAALATTASPFYDNPVIGSSALNQRGLHIERTRLAESIAASRRRRLHRLLTADHREAFLEQGYVCVPNALPDEIFRALAEGGEATPLPAREIKQGGAVTRFTTLSPENLCRLPHLPSFVNGPLFPGLMRYVGTSNADPLVTLHTVFTPPDAPLNDPQTVLHSDTFHSTSKGWLFLRNVDEADGPFSYVPGFHRLTPGRIKWEY
jgi:hypothetical protein